MTRRGEPPSQPSRRRVGVAGFWHETNTYSPRRATLKAFSDFELLRGEDVATRHLGKGTVIGGMLAAPDFEVVPLFSAGAWPSGPADRDTLGGLLQRMEHELLSAGTLDGLLLDLHGAMVCEGVDDVELEVVRLARDVIGDVPVVAVNDLHGNPSPDFVDRCEAVIAYDTFPHVDMRQRGEEAASLMAEALSGRELNTAIGKVPLLSCPLAQATAELPMRALLEEATELAREAGMRRVSLLPGFPYSDVERAGFSALVVHDAARGSEARQVAARLGEKVGARKDDFVVRREGPADAVRRALDVPQGPVLLADVADNIGAGGPGDGTAILAELLAQGAHNAVVLIVDPDLARSAARLGPGASIEADVGAKADDLHGSPVRVRGRVHAVTDGRYRSRGTWMFGREFCMGVTAVVETGRVTLVAMERATPPFHQEQLTSVGVEPEQKSTIVVKGAVAWRAAYENVVTQTIEVDTPGVCPVDPAMLHRETEPIRC